MKSFLTNLFIGLALGAGAIVMLGAKSKEVEPVIADQLLPIVGFVDPEPLLLREGELENLRITLLFQCDPEAPINQGGGGGLGPPCTAMPGQDTVLFPGPFATDIRIAQPSGAVSTRFGQASYSGGESNFGANRFSFAENTDLVTEGGVSEVTARIDSVPNVTGPERVPQLIIRQWLVSGGADGAVARNDQDLAVSDVTVSATTCQAQTSVTNAFADVEVAFVVSNALSRPSDHLFGGISARRPEDGRYTDAGDFYVQNGIFPLASVAPGTNSTRQVTWRFRLNTPDQETQERVFDICVGLRRSDRTPANNCVRSDSFTIAALCN